MAVRRAPPLSARSERDLFAEYPFLPGAEALVEELSLTVRDLLFDPAFERARELGRARVRAAADDPNATRGLEELVHATREERFLSFQYARLLLAAYPVGAALRRWAVAEAKRSHARLARAPAAEMVEVGRRLGRAVAPVEGGVELALPDYLRLGVPIRETEYRLAQQELRAGRVRVRPERAARLLQEGVRLALAVPAAITSEIRAALAEREAAFFRELAERIPAPQSRIGLGFGPLRPLQFPPCIRKMRRMLEAGENLSHAGRFALAAFLHRVGADFETIVDAYRGAPDFDEGITRYQVEHITRRDEGRGYSVPECETVRSHGLCFRDGDPAAAAPVDRARDGLCHEPFLRHPVQYYEIRTGAPVASPRPARP